MAFDPTSLAAENAPTTKAGFEPTIGYDIARDGIVTDTLIRAEMGQPVGTALARILADELEAEGPRGLDEGDLVRGGALVDRAGRREWGSRGGGRRKRRGGSS